MKKGLSVVLLLLITLWQTPVTAADDIDARIWMQFDATNRSTYVIGFMNGLEYLVKIYGQELRSASGARITYREMSEIVYRRLLREPELRSGPMSEIIVSTLIGPYVTITDRSGQPVPKR